jgi:hypothetical protein
MILIQTFVFRLSESGDLSIVGDDLSASSIFFCVSGSTYRRRRTSSSSSNINSGRFRVCITAPILEHLHEVNSLLFFYLIKKIKF